MHGDDFTASGSKRRLDWFKVELSERYELKEEARIRPDSTYAAIRHSPTSIVSPRLDCSPASPQAEPGANDPSTKLPGHGQGDCWRRASREICRGRIVTLRGMAGGAVTAEETAAAGFEELAAAKKAVPAPAAKLSTTHLRRARATRQRDRPCSMN